MRLLRLGAGGAAFLLSLGAVFAAPPTGPVDNGLKYPLDAPLPHKERGRSAHVNSARIDLDGPPEVAALDEISQLLGQGYNSFSGRVTGQCADGTMHIPAPKTFSGSYSLQLVRSSAELQQAMSAEASVAGDFASWSAKASAKLESDLTSKRQSDYLLVKTRVSASPRVTLLDPAPRPAEVPRDQSPQEQAKFFQYCGDQYVAYVVMGGEFVALLTYQSDSEDQRRSFEGSFSASGFSTTVSADFQQKMQSVKNNLALALESTWVGGSGGPIDTSVDSLIRHSLDFPKTVDGKNDALVGFATEPYSNIRVQAGDYEDVKHKFDALKKASLERQSFFALLLKIKGVDDEYGLGDPYAEIRNQTDSQIKQSRQLVADCSRAPWRCNIPESLENFSRPDSVFEPKVVNIPVTDSNFWGSLTTPAGGAHFKIMGHICYHDNGNCHNADEGGIKLTVTPKDGSFPSDYRTPFTLAAGATVTFHLEDSEYGDNTGTLTAIMY